MSELKKLPNVGKATERDLLAMGYTTVDSLKGKTAEELYAEECALRGFTLDRCQLYLYRALVWWINAENPDPAKSRWWFWKDEFASPSPCGTICAECPSFPSACGGCRKTEGKAPWLTYAGPEACPVYACCVREKGQKHCGGCPALPCERFMKDPAVPDEVNEAHLRQRLKNLKSATEKKE